MINTIVIKDINKTLLTSRKTLKFLITSRVVMLSSSLEVVFIIFLLIIYCDMYSPIIEHSIIEKDNATKPIITNSDIIFSAIVFFVSPSAKKTSISLVLSFI